MVKGRPIITSSNRNLADWRRLVSDAAQTHAHMHDGPVNIHLVFGLPRPVSLPKKVKHHVKKPDLDKLCRSVIDSLTGIMYHDDSYIVFLKATKVYEEKPHVIIRIDDAA